MINLKTNLDTHELQTLANLPSGDFWCMLKKLIGADLERLEDEVRKTPKLSNEDLTEDLRFKIGGIDRLKWVLELPDEARSLLK